MTRISKNQKGAICVVSDSITGDVTYGFMPQTKKRKKKAKPFKGWIYEHHEDGIVEETFTTWYKDYCLHRAAEMYAVTEDSELKECGRVRRVEVRIL